jgi:hypothetical protein
MIRDNLSNEDSGGDGDGDGDNDIVMETVIFKVIVMETMIW